MSTHLIHLYLVEYAFFSLKKSKIVSGLTFRKEKKYKDFSWNYFFITPTDKKNRLSLVRVVILRLKEKGTCKKNVETI